MRKYFFFLFIFICSVVFAEPLKLTFKIDEDYLIIHILQFSEKRIQYYKSEYVDDLQSFKKELSANCTLQEKAFIQKVYTELFTYLQLPDLKKCSEFSSVIEKAKKTKAYPILLQQTQKYLEGVEEQWKRNFEKTYQIMTDLTNLHFEGNYTVYITHPGLANGLSLGNNIIEWGGAEVEKNWSTFYLWHEIMHTYLHGGIEHAILQFVTDCELRKHLNNTVYPPFLGHKHLMSLMKDIYPYWMDYLHSEEKDIMQFTNAMKKLFPEEEYFETAP